MKVGVTAESRPGERRVACLPATVPLLTGTGLTVLIQTGAGRHARATDDDYARAGARIVDELSAAALVVAVRPPEPDTLRAGATVVALTDPPNPQALADKDITAYSLSRLPRITRAQGMDALSSQALVAGYRAVLLAAERLPRFLPMFTTAAGTIAPAKVLVLGAGVAGLQAIATARRLGAVVTAYDVRAAAVEEVRSLGAKFLDLGLGTQDGTGGYAAAQSEDFLARQREALAKQVAVSDVVITTAAVPGRPAPVLVTSGMVEGMPPGSVVVDLAAESGGNCELTVAGREVDHGGVSVLGAVDVPSGLPVHASQLYARNVANFVRHLTQDGELRADAADDEILAGCRVPLGGNG
ncbi:NAD(P) transhydrogenase subunit alpha [Crossiella equi]|uniref:proton-translocating NAD(P)(+) transhydrogenase n=1 Tax=Crossiella equi TaxID=130796 RepID=A0ABS5A8Q8_9PSEU|nr:NAD(P) transhydrogenase subunit alpha [Crossiella equi]MBP2472599.1 NAD(P) transhydrogenase subunit alpha [Crossiella equi]